MRNAAFVVLVVALVGCGADPGPSTADETTTTTPAITATSGAEIETTTMPATESEPLPIVGPARADLTSRLGVDPGDLEVISAEEVTWPDGSLGCPQPGMSYTQALVEGSKVVLGHDGRVYVYHAGADGDPFLCPSEEKDGGYDFVPPPGFRE